MRVLVTGSRGLVGPAVVSRLEEGGDSVSQYDRVDGMDVLDPEALTAAAAACEQIVHLAAVDDPIEADVVPDELLPSSQGAPEEVVAVTVLGTRNVLEAARTAGHSRVVVMSSVDALGIFLGQRPPDYLPIDAGHPTYPRSPYALAKRIAERMCADFTDATGISTLCLRPPGVWTDETFAVVRQRFDEDPMNDRRPFWEYGAFIALPDLADAVHCAVHRPWEGHAVLHVCSDDVVLAQQTSREAAQAIHPSVPWRGGDEYERDPFLTLLDNRPAKTLLDWQPRVRFRPT